MAAPAPGPAAGRRRRDARTGYTQMAASGAEPRERGAAREQQHAASGLGSERERQLRDRRTLARETQQAHGPNRRDETVSRVAAPVGNELVSEPKGVVPPRAAGGSAGDSSPRAHGGDLLAHAELGEDLVGVLADRRRGRAGTRGRRREARRRA